MSLHLLTTAASPSVTAPRTPRLARGGNCRVLTTAALLIEIGAPDAFLTDEAVRVFPAGSLAEPSTQALADPSSALSFVGVAF